MYYSAPAVTIKDATVHFLYISYSECDIRLCPTKIKNIYINFFKCKVRSGKAYLLYLQILGHKKKVQHVKIDIRFPEGNYHEVMGRSSADFVQTCRGNDCRAGLQTDQSHFAPNQSEETADNQSDLEVNRTERKANQWRDSESLLHLESINCR